MCRSKCWDEWTAWGTCSGPCNTGSRLRTRTRKTPPPVSSLLHIHFVFTNFSNSHVAANWPVFGAHRMQRILGRHPIPTTLIVFLQILVIRIPLLVIEIALPCELKISFMKNIMPVKNSDLMHLIDFFLKTCPLLYQQECRNIQCVGSGSQSQECVMDCGVGGNPAQDHCACLPGYIGVCCDQSKHH